MNKFLKFSCLLAGMLLSGLARADGGFLFATFRGERTPMSEQIYFATSTNGRSWTVLGDGKPILVSTLGTKGVRDPFLVRSPDGRKFWLIATDLSVHFLEHNWRKAAREGSKSIVVWESTDLVKWSEPWLAKVSPEDAGCTWAPQAIFDPETEDYLVYWSSVNGRDQFGKFRVWATRTKDFKTYGEPFIYIEQADPIIDTDIVHDGQKYHRFTKNERHTLIYQESAEKLAGPWTKVETFSLATTKGYEGPQCFLLTPASATQPAVWCLLLDFFTRGQGYQAFVTTDLATGKFEPAGDFRFPYRFRHGAVLSITAEELERLSQAYPNSAPSTQPSSGR